MCYIKLTTKCNMSCIHCCGNYTAKGKDMTIKTWEQTVKFCLDYGFESISLGGGEPTCAPIFHKAMFDAIANFESVWMAINGKITKTALLLAKMAQKGILGVALSQDEYHDPIATEVILAFQKEDGHKWDKDKNDLREIRDVTGREIKSGRCQWGNPKDCICPSLIIEPTGVIRGCGCKDAPTFGTVFDPKIPQDWDTCSCHREQENIREKTEYELDKEMADL